VLQLHLNTKKTHNRAQLTTAPYPGSLELQQLVSVTRVFIHPVSYISDHYTEQVSKCLALGLAQTRGPHPAKVSS